MSNKILIVEDEMIIAADISMMLNKLGYEVTGIMSRGEDALKNIESTHPDIVLMDVGLKGELDGVQTSAQIYEQFNIPVIFLTSNADEATFQRAKSTRPYAFISKPFQQAALKRAIELTLERISEEVVTEKENIQVSEIDQEPFILSDRIFVRHKDRMVKVFIQDILFAEADRNYCMVHTVDREYLLTVPLRVLEDNLPKEQFMRVHRSYLVNLGKIDALTDNQEFLALGRKNVPVSRRFKEEVLKRLKLI